MGKKNRSRPSRTKATAVAAPSADLKDHGSKVALDDVGLDDVDACTLSFYYYYYYVYNYYYYLF
jgi:hypothetical protein